MVASQGSDRSVDLMPTEQEFALCPRLELELTDAEVAALEEQLRWLRKQLRLDGLF